MIDSGRGKLSTHLDLRHQADRDRLRALVRESDVFCQSYRPDALGTRGLSPEELTALRPGIGTHPPAWPERDEPA